MSTANPGIKPWTPALQADSLSAEPQGKPKNTGLGSHSLLQYSCLENPMDRGAWWATFHGVTKSQIQFSYQTTRTMKMQGTMTLKDGRPNLIFWVAGKWQAGGVDRWVVSRQ